MRQPSVPIDDLLHVLPTVPRIPYLLSAWQKSGEVAAYTRLDGGGRLLFVFLFRPRRPRDILVSLVLFLFSLTLNALSNFRRSKEATFAIFGMVRQHTRTVHEPETPWHLQLLSIFSLMA